MDRERTEKVSRQEVRAVECPGCGARPGEPCAGRRGQPREANHAARVEKARAALRNDPDALAWTLLRQPSVSEQ